MHVELEMVKGLLDVKLSGTPMGMGLLWYMLLKNDARYTYVAVHIDRLKFGRVAKLFYAVDFMTRRCDEEINEKVLINTGRKLGIRVRTCSDCTEDERFARSDFEILRATLPILRAIQKAYCAKKLNIPI
jgi:hypothetical protein